MKAFPTEHPLIGTMNTFSDGMDLRDYFAAKAMQAIVESTTHKTPFLATYNIADNNKISKISYEIADAMMKAREQ